MTEKSNELTSNAEASLDILRVETALSRYPIHRLANKGTININLKKVDEKGTATLLWEVTYNSKYGQPGPLAYKLDTLVINRKIDDAPRPIPKMLKLGSLREIADELDLGTNTNAVRTALRQNASAFIVAKINYQTLDRTEKKLEADFTRYSIIFTGDKLPDGREAECVYLIFNEPFLEVLNNVSRRPLDYDYLKELTPGAQRFYEIVSYQMLPAIKYSQRAKLSYSEFCMFSTMTRYETFNQVKKQMYKIHLPHVKAGYIAKVEYEQVLDADGKPDWNMFYVPGEKAKFQHLVFSFAIANSPKSKVTPSPSEKKEKGRVGKGEGETTTATKFQRPSFPETLLESSSNEKAAELVKTFYGIRFGQEQEPTEREIAEAAGYLAEGTEWGSHLIEFGARQGKESGKFPEAFGGLKKLVSQAREPHEANCKTRDHVAFKKARQCHQEAHREAYRAFLGELLGGMLKETLPEAFAAFESDEKSVYLFHKARAGKSAMSAKITEEYYAEKTRIDRFVKFVEENPRSGVPSFWQWDDKLNATPFTPSRNIIS